jgi:hypothetical protein
MVRFIPHVLAAAMPSLAGGLSGGSGAPPGTMLDPDGGASEPPPGTIYVKTAHGGFAVPPRRFALHVGRATLDVHVPVGVGDRYVSRLHGVFTCDGGTRWRLRNEGRVPIQTLGEELLLSGHEMEVSAGYTPMAIETSPTRSHWIEVYVVGTASATDDADSEASTLRPVTYELSPVERLVIAALAQAYLRRDRHPMPASWRQVADDVGRADPQRRWDVKSAQRIVAGVRKRLAESSHPVPGPVQAAPGEYTGNTLNHNLIQALLKDATLLPEDLDVLGEDGGRE